MHVILLAGALLAGVPVAIHLLLRQEPKRVPFPAVRFLKLAQKTSQRKLRLRHILLLLLRVLVIALFCVALFQPVVPSFDAGFAGEQYLVDASGKTLGRLSTELARRLRGKHKPVYTPHVDTGDYLVVINAEKIAVTGKKLTDKKYHRFTGYIGNLKTENLAQALERHPEQVIETAVKGMLPKNPLGRAMYRKLKVYAGSEHPHAAQQPQVLDI